jgi:hypothetical protein
MKMNFIFNYTRRGQQAKQQRASVLIWPRRTPNTEAPRHREIGVGAANEHEYTPISNSEKSSAGAGLGNDLAYGSFSYSRFFA